MKASIRKRIDAANAALALPPAVKRKSYSQGKRTPPSKKLKISGTDLKDVPPADHPEVLSLERMMALTVQGNTQGEIAAIMGCTIGNVHQRLRPFQQKLRALKDFQNNKGDLYDLKQADLLAALTTEVIEQMPGKDIIQGMKTLEDMGRKVKGLDMHQNINIFSLTVKAAYALPLGTTASLKEVCIGQDDSGSRLLGNQDVHDGNQNKELQDGVRGAGIPTDVCEEGLQEVPRDREHWVPDAIKGCPGYPEPKNPAVYLPVAGRDDSHGTGEDPLPAE